MRIARVVVGYIDSGLDTGGTAAELQHRVRRFVDSNQNQPNWNSLSAFEADTIPATISKYHDIQLGRTVLPPRVPDVTQTTALRRSDPGTTTVLPPRTTTTRRSDPDTTVPHVAFPQPVTEGSKRRRVQTVEEMLSDEEKPSDEVEDTLRRIPVDESIRSRFLASAK